MDHTHSGRRPRRKEEPRDKKKIKDRGEEGGGERLTVEGDCCTTGISGVTPAGAPRQGLPVRAIPTGVTISFTWTLTVEEPYFYR